MLIYVLFQFLKSCPVQGAVPRLISTKSELIAFVRPKFRRTDEVNAGSNFRLVGAF